MRLNVTLFGGKPTPFDGYSGTLRNTTAGGVQHAEDKLSTSVTLLGGKSVPSGSLSVILRHRCSTPVDVAELDLSLGVALFSHLT